MPQEFYRRSFWFLETSVGTLSMPAFLFPCNYGQTSFILQLLWPNERRIHCWIIEHCIDNGYIHDCWIDTFNHHMQTRHSLLQWLCALFYWYWLEAYRNVSVVVSDQRRLLLRICPIITTWSVANLILSLTTALILAFSQWLHNTRQCSNQKLTMSSKPPSVHARASLIT